MKLDIATTQRLLQSGASFVDGRTIRASKDAAKGTLGSTMGASPTLTPQSSCAELESISSDHGDVSSGNEVVAASNIAGQPRTNRKRQSRPQIRSQLPPWLQSSDSKASSSLQREALRAKGNEQLLAMLNSQPDSSTRTRLRTTGAAVLNDLRPVTKRVGSEPVPVQQDVRVDVARSVDIPCVQHMSASRLHAAAELSQLEALQFVFWMRAFPAVNVSSGALDSTCCTGPAASTPLGQPMKIELGAQIRLPLGIAPPPGL